MRKKLCEKCNYEYTVCNFEKHFPKCNGTINYWKRKQLGVESPYENLIVCRFCQRVGKSFRSNVTHETFCKKNPDKKYRVPSYGMKGKKGANQHTKGTAKPPSEKALLSWKKLSERNKSKVWDEETRKKHSIAMKAAVASNPQSYTSSNRGRTKQITYNGIKFQGSWELKFYKWCETNKVVCIRNEEGFKYFWNGERTYYPDFFLPEKNVYVEIKGYQTEKDEAKWKYFEKKLICLKKQDILNIDKGTFQLDVLI